MHCPECSDVFGFHVVFMYGCPTCNCHCEVKLSTTQCIISSGCIAAQRHVIAGIDKVSNIKYRRLRGLWISTQKVWHVSTNTRFDAMVHVMLVSSELMPIAALQ